MPLGDILYRGALLWNRLVGNTTTTKKFLSQTGTGIISAIPVWDTIGGSSITGFTSGSVIFGNTDGTLTQDNANFFFNNTTDQLKVTGSILCPIIIGDTTTTGDLRLRATSGAGTTGARVFLEVGTDGAIQAVEAGRDSGGNFGVLGVGTPGNLALSQPLTVFGTGSDIGYLIVARAAGGAPSAYSQMQTGGADANAQAGFSFAQRQNLLEWRMAVTGNEGNFMRWKAVDTSGAPFDRNIMYVTPRGNIIIDDSYNKEPTTGSKGLVFGDGTLLGTMASNTCGLFGNDVGGTVNLFSINEANEVNQLSGDIILASGKFFISNVAAFMIKTITTWSNGAAAGAGTLTNAPAAGDPTKWIPVDDNGTTRYIPAW